MLQEIPRENVINVDIDNIPCMAAKGRFCGVSIGIGTPLRFELHAREDIIALKELCEFALKE